MPTVLKSFPIALCLIGPFAAPSAAQYEPIFDNTHVLRRGQLSVEVMDPTADDRQDRSVRFSPLAFIIQMNHAGTDYFYAPPNVTDMAWNNDRSKYPAGAPMEFDLSDFDIIPPGFDATKRGPGGAAPEYDEFIKIGVGILRNNRSSGSRDRYAFTHDYPLAEPSHTQVSWEADRATFVQTLPRETDSGYRYELLTSVQLQDDQLQLVYRLTNNGSKPFTTSQYVHNFTRIADQPVGPAYEVAVPWPFTATNLNRAQPVLQDDRKLLYTGPIRGNNKPVIPTDQLQDQPFEFTVRQTEINRGLRVSAELPADTDGASADPLAVAVWSMNSSQLSPEQFVVLSLDPGQSIEWTRRYTVIPEPNSLTLLAIGLALAAAFLRRPS